MGLSGILLKEKNKIIFNDLVDNIKIATKNANLEYILGGEMEQNDDGSYEYITMNIIDRKAENTRDFLMYIYNKSDSIYDNDFDWIRKEKYLNQIINIENFSECEDMLLKFVYEYLKLNKEDIFYDELKWYYTLEDIQKIHNSLFDKEWCYKPPI